jgi:sigma-B regulation protein RsbU (phosphoserine phosphatase)
MSSTSDVYALLSTGEAYSLEDQLELLAEVTQSFAASLEIEATLHNAIEKFMQYLDAEAASIFLLDTDTDADNPDLVCRACAGPVDISGMRLPGDTGIIGKTVVSRCCQIVRDVSKDPDFAKHVDADTGFVTRSILCTPLIVRQQCIGALELINKRGGDGLFDDRDRYLLGALASSAALAIHNARMADQLVEQERMQKELELAREIQMDLLPAPGDAGFPVVGMNVPAREVSGDFYDFLQREDGLIYFSLADVSGKGMNAALLMAKVSSLLHHLARAIADPGELLARVNVELCESISHGMFVTIVAGFLDPESGRIDLANAGHQPPLLHHVDGSFEEIVATAPPLGVVAGCQFPVTTLQLDDSSLYLFTDGITESLDENNRPLAVEGFIELVRATEYGPAARRLQGMVAELRKPVVSQRDDITLMVIEIDGDRRPDAMKTQQIFALHFRAEPERLGPVRALVKRAAQSFGCTEALADKLVIAVNEACMNVIQHAYRGDGSGEVSLEVRTNGKQVIFRLEDQADPIDLKCVQPRDLNELRPGGLGVHFIREIMDHCEMGHLDKKRGNYLEMRKAID